MSVSALIAATEEQAPPTSANEYDLAAWRWMEAHVSIRAPGAKDRDGNPTGVPLVTLPAAPRTSTSRRCSRSAATCGNSAAPGSTASPCSLMRRSAATAVPTSSSPDERTSRRSTTSRAPSATPARSGFWLPVTIGGADDDRDRPLLLEALPDACGGDGRWAARSRPTRTATRHSRSLLDERRPPAWSSIATPDANTDDVVAALNLKMTDLYDEAPAAAERRRIVTTHPYHDTDGTVLYRVARYEPKGFLPQTSDDGGRTWRNGYNDRPRRLYRLPRC